MDSRLLWREPGREADDEAESPQEQNGPLGLAEPQGAMHCFRASKGWAALDPSFLGRPDPIASSQGDEGPLKSTHATAKLGARSRARGVLSGPPDIPACLQGTENAGPLGRLGCHSEGAHLGGGTLRRSVPDARIRLPRLRPRDPREGEWAQTLADHQRRLAVSQEAVSDLEGGNLGGPGTGREEGVQQGPGSDGSRGAALVLSSCHFSLPLPVLA